MKWKNLVYNKCPKCEKGDLDFEDGKITCIKCSFKISEEKMAEIVAKESEKSGEYDNSKEMVLCDVCGREFEGEAWMMQSTRKITCPECYRDTKAFL